MSPHHNNHARYFPDIGKRKEPFENETTDNKKLQSRTNDNNNNHDPTCRNCGKNHLDECRKGTLNCYTCGQSVYILKDCTYSQGLP